MTTVLLGQFLWRLLKSAYAVDCPVQSVATYEIVMYWHARSTAYSVITVLPYNECITSTKVLIFSRLSLPYRTKREKRTKGEN